MLPGANTGIETQHLNLPQKNRSRLCHPVGGVQRRSPFIALGPTLLLVLTWSPSSFSQSRTFTVRDSIEMQTFIDPYPFNPTSLQSEQVKYSPGNRFFALVTQRGLLQSNELESTLWVFEVDAVRQFHVSPGTIERPKPRAIARMAAMADDSSITQLRWVSDAKLAFLGRDKSLKRRLFTADVSTGALKRLSPLGQDVTQFDFTERTVVYTVALTADKPPEANEIVLTGHSIVSALGWESPDHFPQLGTPATLWVIRDKKASPVKDVTTGKPIQLTTDILSLSPSGRFVATTQHAVRIPEAWEAYEPFPDSLSDFVRLKKSAPGKRKEGLLYRLLQPKQYAVVDLDTGKVDAIDAPVGQALDYFGPSKVVWSHDNRRVILLNTYIPLENSVETERDRLLRAPCIALLETGSHRITCVASVKQSGRAQYLAEGTAYNLTDVTWGKTSSEIILSYSTYGKPKGDELYEYGPETYRLHDDMWTQVKDGPPPTSVHLWVGVRQDLNNPPTLFVSNSSKEQGLKLWDPNPQLRTINLGEVSVYRWKDKAGREWQGGLVKPPNFKPGRRYPLVIQTHGFNNQQFMTVGTFTTAFAARPLAATGILVLQAADAFDLLTTPQEAPVNVQGYEAAIDQLSEEGLVDPARVGLIGFSRSGYYALEGLTKNPERFAAATIADSDFLGYMQRLLGVDIGDTGKKEGIAIYGSQPFGDGLKTWLKEAPAFNLDKIVAPVRIEVHGRESLLFNWEVYAGLRLQDKSVDLILLPDATHIVTKPLERLASEQGDVDWFRFWLKGEEDPDPAKADQYSRWHALRELQEKNASSSLKH
jgi:dipeptidyl aminopeptidase/acylaminoacyl peptidase